MVKRNWQETDMAINKSTPTAVTAAATWEDISGEDIAATFTFQNVGGNLIWLYAGTALPTGGPRGIAYQGGEGEQGLTLAEFNPGVTSPTRLYAFAPVGGYYTLMAD